MLIESLVELHVGLHSCLCFSHLEKLVLIAGSTPPRYLFDTLLSVELLQLFLIAIPIDSRYLVDRLRMALHPRQLLDTWWIDRASVLDSVGLFLDTSSIPQQSTTFFSIPSLTDILIPLDTCICRDLLLALFKLPVRSRTHFTRSLSRYLSLFSPKRSHLTPIFGPQGFFKLFQEFLHLVSF